jgi:hypothetical protein
MNTPRCPRRLPPRRPRRRRPLRRRPRLWPGRLRRLVLLPPRRRPPPLRQRRQPHLLPPSKRIAKQQYGEAADATSPFFCLRIVDGHPAAADHQRPHHRQRVCRGGARLHHGLRRDPVDQLRPRRSGDGRRHGGLFGDRRAGRRLPATAGDRAGRRACGGAGLHAARLWPGARRLPPAAPRAAPSAADHGDRHVHHPATPGAADLGPQPDRLSAIDRQPELRHRRCRHQRRADRHHPDVDG